jgi:hypothetical protein
LHHLRDALPRDAEHPPDRRPRHARLDCCSNGAGASCASLCEIPLGSTHTVDSIEYVS